MSGPAESGTKVAVLKVDAAAAAPSPPAACVGTTTRWARRERMESMSSSLNLAVSCSASSPKTCAEERV